MSELLIVLTGLICFVGGTWIVKYGSHQLRCFMWLCLLIWSLVLLAWFGIILAYVQLGAELDLDIRSTFSLLLHVGIWISATGPLIMIGSFAVLLKENRKKNHKPKQSSQGE